jgi:hypothetical protein
LARKKKREHSWLADIIFATGWPPGIEVTYDLLVGVWLNLHRHQLQQATHVSLGLWAYHTDECLPFEWFDAVASDRAEAISLESEENLRRSNNQATRKMR